MTGAGEVRPARRRHRWLTVPSGWLLVVCLMLPSLKFCDGSLPALVVPFAWPPFLLGALVAVAATSSTVRGAARAYAGVLCWYVRLNVIAWCGWLLYIAVDSHHVDPALWIVFAGGVVLWFMTAGERTEAAAARISTFASATVALLIGLVLPDPHILWGIWVAFACACAMTIGAIWWWIEVYADSR